MSSPGGVIRDIVWYGIWLEGIAKPLEDLSQLIGGQQVKQHQDIRLLGHLVAIR